MENNTDTNKVSKLQCKRLQRLHPFQATFFSPHFSLSFSANENVTFAYAYM